jgi:signal transduction histidine kinase
MYTPAQPPRTLIAAIAAIVVVPLALLLWLGWRFLDQDRLLERQQAQDRLERSADLAIGALQRAVAAAEQRLAAGANDWPEGAVTLVFHGPTIDAHPFGRIAWLPAVPPLPEASADRFAEGEALEFRQHDRAAAIRKYAELANSRDPAIRAGALLRLARNYKSENRADDALATYSHLAAIDGVAAGGAPAALAARYGRCKLLAETGRADDLHREAQALAADLHTGRWPLTGAVYWLYAADVDAWTGGARDPLPSESLAEAADSFAAKAYAVPDSGRELVRTGGPPVTVVWTRSGGSLHALLATQEFVQTQWLADAAPVAAQQHVRLALDAAPPFPDRRAARNSRETALPWNIAVFPDGTAADTGFAQRKRLLITGFVLLVSMALAAGLLIFRAVNREFAVARLQSDFVAAVSHEFRTPLTTLRQFTDMLRDHKALSDERRALCYEAQARATDRLTRLVESLLDFGRMEAGSRPYLFERRDCAELAQRTVEEFQAGPQAAGFELRFQNGGPPAAIDADGEALARALWNLLDNAVKYSPEGGAVEIGVRRFEGAVAISVCDYGIGIPPHEQQTVFGRFQRGEQARSLGIKGTGIGLAMVDHIVRAHHGRVELESRPGAGSTFTIVLPVKEES